MMSNWNRNRLAFAYMAIIGLIVIIVAVAAPGAVIGTGVIYATATLAFVTGVVLTLIGIVGALLLKN